MNHVMRLCIDARLVTTNPTGIGRYTAELLRSKAISDGPFQITALVNDAKSFRQVIDDDRISTVAVTAAFLSTKEQVELPTILGRGQFDLFFSPSFSVPFVCPVPLVFTLHDLNHLKFSTGFAGVVHRLYYRLFVGRAVSQARTIFLDSASAQAEIENLFPQAIGKTTLAGAGVDARFFSGGRASDQDMIRVRNKYRLPERFVLYVGNHKPHKNVPFLIRAFSHVNQPGLVLVLSGMPSHADQMAIDERALHNRVMFTGSIDDSDLIAVYKSATLFAFPSLYEGFGLPPLEAMASGTPVIASNLSAMPEVIGDSGLLLDPTDEVAWAEGITRVVSDPKLHSHLRQSGLARAEQFSWESVGKAVAAALVAVGARLKRS